MPCDAPTQEVNHKEKTASCPKEQRVHTSLSPIQLWLLLWVSLLLPCAKVAAELSSFKPLGNGLT